SYTRLVKVSELGHSTFDRNLKALVKNKLVVKTGEGRGALYSITDLGQHARQEGAVPSLPNNYHGSNGTDHNITTITPTPLYKGSDGSNGGSENGSAIRIETNNGATHPTDTSSGCGYCGAPKDAGEIVCASCKSKHDKKQVKEQRERDERE